jgi:ATP-dependent Clp protease protease subunit
VTHHHPLAAIEQAAPEILPAVMRGTPGMTLSDSVSERLLRERIIILGSEVKDSNANEITAQLLLLAAEDAEKDITLYINSPGGSSLRAWRSTTRCSSCRTTSPPYGMGMAASMGQFLLLAPAPRASATRCRTPAI